MIVSIDPYEYHEFSLYYNTSRCNIAFRVFLDNSDRVFLLSHQTSSEFLIKKKSFFVDLSEVNVNTSKINVTI